MDTEVERKHVAAFNTMLDNVSLMQFYSKISDPYTEEQMEDIERLLCEMEDTYEQFQEYLSAREQNGSYTVSDVISEIENVM